MKKRLYHLLFASLFSMSFFVFVVGVMVSPASGVPGTGTSITVRNAVSGPVPSSPWSYTITERNPPPGKKPYTASFTLPAGGGGTDSFGGLRSGLYRVAEASKFGYYATYAVTSNKYSPGPSGTGFDVIINLTSSEGKTVTFTNTAMPAFAMTGLIVPPPSDLGYSIPPLKPIPVQASWDVDINNDGRLDLVLGKPTAILVNLTGPSFQLGDQITVSVLFEGNVYNRFVTGADLASNRVVSYYPIVPSSAGNETITGIYQVNGGAEVALATTNVTVKNTKDLSLFYAYLTKPSSYGAESQPAFNDMAAKSLDFINATYPIKNITANVNYMSITGSKPGPARDKTAGMLKDAQAVADQAKLLMGGSAVGIAIAPPADAGLPDYFTYHGFPGAAGVSFGECVKGVIALDGYWTVPAHEVAHTFNLYFGVPEEYKLPGAPFPASGVSPSSGAWRTGYNFMSVAEYKTTNLTWVNTNITYAYLFRNTTMIPNDPPILLVSGIVYKNDDGTMTVEFPRDWVRLRDGIPDTLTPGDYLLKFVNTTTGTTLGQISFGLSFSIQIDYPGVSPMGGSSIETGESGFSFAIPYPPIGTEEVQVVSPTGVVLATYYMADVKSFRCSASLAGTEGLNDWYVSPVNVTITATADPTAIQPYFVKEIHYILDGSETTIGGSSTQVNIQTDGIHSLEYWSVDNLDNVGAHHIQTVKIDKTAPSTTDDYDGLWHKSDFTIKLTATNGASGVSATYYKINDGATKSVSVNGQPQITTESATNKLEYWSVDVAGNVESHHTLSNTKLDKTAPVTTKGLSGTAGLNGWYVSSVDVALSATDSGGSGVKEIHYKLDGVETTVSGGATSFTISAEGSHSVEHWAVDNAGNEETHATQTVKVDKTAPVVTITAPASGAYYKTSTVPAGAYTVTEANPYTAVVSGPSTSEGAGSYTVTATDAAGNVGSASVTYTVDNTAPIVTITAPSNGAYYRTANVPLKAYTAIDTNPITIVETGYSTAEGVQTYTVTATDGAGNVGSASVTYTVDNTAPVVTINAPVNGANYTLGQSVAADWNATDSLSGIYSAVGTVASGQLIDTRTVGAKTFTVTAVDKAGNTATVTVTYNVGYVFGGFLQPIPDSVYNLGRTVPVKFRLTDSQGNFVTTAIARIYVAQKVNGVWREIPGYGNLFWYNSATDMYQFNLDTTGLSLGELQITVVLDDGTLHTVVIGLT